MKDKLENKTTNLAGRNYQVEDYQNSQDQLANGLAMTHEQVSDTYMEGEIGYESERNGKNVTAPSPTEGYEK